MSEEIEAKIRLLLELNSYEARAYLTLLRSGPLKAVDLADEAGIPRGRIYDVLRRLEAKGLINRVDHAYEAVNPRRALSRISQKKLVDALDVMRKIEELADELEKTFRKTDAGEEIRLIHGLKESLAAALSSLAQCDGRIYFVAFKSAEKSLEYWDLLEPLIERLPENVRIIIPSNLDVPEKPLQSLLNKGVEVRMSPAVMLDLMTACDTVIIGLPSSRHEVISVYIRHPGFASSLLERLDEMWLKAASINT